MDNKPQTKKIITILLVVALIVGAFIFLTNYRNGKCGDGFFYKTRCAVPVEEDQPQESQDDDNKDDTQLAENQELPEELKVYNGWKQIEGNGYAFLHPGYLAKEENGYHIVAYEPVKGGEFSALAIRKPFGTNNIIADLSKMVSDSDASVRAKVVMEPEEVSVEGTKSAYEFEYQIDSGPNSGINKVYALQSPGTSMWVTIQYASGNETAENIRKSFHFIDY